MSNTPYTKSYEKIKDIDQFFEYNADTKEMIFNSESLVIYIPKRYEVYDQLNISDTVKTLAVFDMVIDDKYHAGLMMFVNIEIEADDISQIMIGNIQYVVLNLTKGSRFICHTEIIADDSIVYTIWMEFISRGKLIYNIDYQTLSRLFDQSKSMCNVTIPVDHAIFEVIYSHLCRDPDNLAVQYRQTDMKKPFKFVPLTNVGYSTTSTTSKLLGSYFGQSLNSALIHTNDTQTPLEGLLRS